MARGEPLIRATIFSDFAGSNILNVIHLIHSVPLTTTELINCAGTVRIQWIQSLNNFLSPAGMTYRKVRCQFVGRDDIAPGEVTFADGWPTRNGMPPQVAYRLRLFTFLGNRRGQGRYFVAGACTDHCTTGMLNQNGQTNMGQFLAAVTPKWVGSSSTSGFTLVVRSRAGNTWNEVNSIQADSIFSTLRTRRFGIGY